MVYTTFYKSPIGTILLASKDNRLIGSWIEGQKYYLGNLKESTQEKVTNLSYCKLKYG